ncbi:PucR family transcriptional regulator [Embleya scabrispora]|uniref:PucR family transcriptional regulator n=1 Tax=Embleya scabrispora TaxID=159449 RepID=UPI00039C459A|nr:helix-turn-helix domain-containing protein [Embleya scabrispora]MYS79389.1 PucR family transcriptional regulator [Streptomyces sp. SID5474]
MQDRSVLAPVLADLRDALEPFAGEVAAQIRREVPGYAGMTPAEHLSGVEGQLAAILDGLVSHRLPADTDVARARALGARRAELGIPLQDVVNAYHVAYPAIWRELEARAGTPTQQRALLAEVEFVWRWLHLLSTAVAEAHVAETTNRATARAALMRRLVEVLERSPLEASAGTRLLGRLGFDPAGRFVVACVAGLSVTETEALEAALAGPGRLVHGVHQDEYAVVVAQGRPAAAITDALVAGSGDRTGAAGVGRCRDGLVGAAASLLDARDALGRSALTGRVTGFDEDWAGCALEGARPRLEPFAATAAEVVARSPHIAETVRAFAASGFAISGCARRLQIHPNSAKYRLERWRRLTGWDPATYAGLQQSMVALDCCGFGAGDDPPAPKPPVS